MRRDRGVVVCRVESQRVHRNYVVLRRRGVNMRIGVMVGRLFLWADPRASSGTRVGVGLFI